jgi:pimeloyl-ACP methyl ester carboxylesterase
MPTPPTYLLVHGAWCGGFIWRGVADRLRAKGRRVFAPTLSGLADRSHLLGPWIDLQTHVSDVVNLIRWEELSGIVLVGHSYGGMVISSVAEQVPAGAISSIVYLDAFYAASSQSVADCASGLDAAIYEVDAIPFPFAGETGDEHFESLTTPQPRRTMTDRPTLTGARDRVPIKTYVLATSQPRPWFSAMAEALRQDPGWRVREIASGHGMQLELPDETTELLLEAASQLSG